MLLLVYHSVSSRQLIMDPNLISKVKCCLGKTCKLKLSILQYVTANMLAVVLGIKPSFLLDKCNISSEKFAKVASILLLNTKSMNEKHLFRILLFENGEIFFINIASCIDLMRSNLENLLNRNGDSAEHSRSRIVNIHNSLNEPKVISGQDSLKIERIYLNLLEMLEKFAETDTSIPKDNKTVLVHRCVFHSDSNLCTVYGLLLNYPIVYWFDNLISEETCLDMTPLSVVKVGLLFSSNCMLKSDAQSLKTKNMIEIYSFSFPKNLHACLIVNLQKWKTALIEKISPIFDTNYCFQELTVTASSLAL